MVSRDLSVFEERVLKYIQDRDGYYLMKKHLLQGKSLRDISEIVGLGYATVRRRFQKEKRSLHVLIAQAA